MIQTDHGSNFMGRFYRQTISMMGIKHISSSPYHPQNQECLERFYRTLKSVFTKYALENNKDWDEAIQVALYATRCARQESLGYSPFELIFGWVPSENLRILCKVSMGVGVDEGIAECVIRMRRRMVFAPTSGRKP